MKTTPLKDVPVWEPCDCCDEYLCNIHYRHAHECDCPSIDVWATSSFYPYVTKATPDVVAWVENHPHRDDE